MGTHWGLTYILYTHMDTLGKGEPEERMETEHRK